MPVPFQSSTASSSQFLSDHAHAYLDGSVREVEVRPVTHADIAALASGQTPSTFEAYRMRPEGDLTPVVVDAVDDRRGGISTHTTFAVDQNGRVNRAEPVGARIRVEMRDGEGKRSDAFLFTTAAAEEASALGGNARAALGRERLYLPAGQSVPQDQGDQSSLRVIVIGAPQADDTGFDQPEPVASLRLPLAPVHGSQMTASFVVADVAPRDLERRMREVLIREFGDAIGSIVDLNTSVVVPDRVDVRDADTGDLIAVNVLAAEATYLAHGRTIQTEPTRGSIPVG